MAGQLTQKPFSVRFRAGLFAPWAGFQFMRTRPGLWRFGIIPVLLNLLITAVLLAGLLAVAGYFVYVLHPKFDSGWMGRTLEVLSAVGIILLAVAAALIAWVVLQGILCGHFYGKLAEQVEEMLGVRPDELREVPFSHQVADTLGDVGYLAAVNTGCLAIQIVPGIGSVVAMAVSYYTGVMTLGMDFFEHPLGLRGKRRADKRAFAKQHRAQVMGLGTSVAGVTLIPIVSAILLTTAVAGAVLLYHTLSEEGDATADALRTDGAQRVRPTEPEPRVREPRVREQ